jgi:Tfp pilus assembly protein PilV
VSERAQAAPARQREAGLGLIELVIAMSVLSVVLLGFAASFGSLVKAHQITRTKTVAEEVATEQLETIRSMQYDLIGVAGQNPPGTLLATSPPKAVDG